MPSMVQIFVVGGERKRRRVGSAAAAAYCLSVGGAVGPTPTTLKIEQDQQSDGGGGAGAPVFSQDHDFVAPHRPDDIPSSTICNSFPFVHATSTPDAITSSTPTSSCKASNPAGGCENKKLVLTDSMLLVRQQEQQRKDEEDFDSLFDNQHVFGIPNNIGNRSDRSNGTATSSHDDEWQNPPGGIFSPICNNIEDNSATRQGIGEISTNNSTTNTQQSGNVYADANFEGRFNQLLRFKQEFGHCNVSQTYPGLGPWCCSMKFMSSNRFKKGAHKSTSVLSEVRIQRLEQLGFRCNVSSPDVGVSDERRRQLITLRNKFGHCNDPQKCKSDPSVATPHYQHHHTTQDQHQMSISPPASEKNISGLGVLSSSIHPNVTKSNANLTSRTATTSVVSKWDCNAPRAKQGNNASFVATRTYRILELTLVEDSDLKEATGFSFAVLSNLERCFFDENDKRGKRTNIPSLGFPGMACRHCKGASSAIKPKAFHGRTGRYFPTTLKTLSDSKKSLDAMYCHMLKCKHCPTAVKEELATLQTTHAAERKLKIHGSQKRFFSNIWNGLHGSADDRDNDMDKTQKEARDSV